MDVLLDKKRLVEIRNFKGVSQEDLGHCLGGSRRTVQGFESGDGTMVIGHKLANKIAKCLSIDVWNIWGEIPDFWIYEPRIITDNSELSTIALQKCKFVWKPEYLPSYDGHQKALLNLTSIIEESQNSLADINNDQTVSALEDLKRRIEVKNIVDELNFFYGFDIDRQAGLDDWPCFVQYKATQLTHSGDDSNYWSWHIHEELVYQMQSSVKDEWRYHVYSGHPIFEMTDDEKSKALKDRFAPNWL